MTEKISKELAGKIKEKHRGLIYLGKPTKESTFSFFTHLYVSTESDLTNFNDFIDSITEPEKINIKTTEWMPEGAAFLVGKDKEHSYIFKNMEKVTGEVDIKNNKILSYQRRNLPYQEEQPKPEKKEQIEPLDKWKYKRYNEDETDRDIFDKINEIIKHINGEKPPKVETSGGQ
jgi:hypothetical protein